MAISAQEPAKVQACAEGAKCLTAEHEAAAKSDTITKEQADAIVAELKQIRQLLEKEQTRSARL